MGTVLKQVVKRSAVKLARSVFEVDQELQPLFEVFHFFRCLERLKLGFFYFFVGEGFQVEFLKLLGSVRMTGHFEIPLTSLISKPFVVVEHFHNLRQDKLVSGFVVRKGFVEVVGYVDCGIQADYIHGAEGGGLGSADHWASKFVHFRNAKAHFINGVHARNDGINSNAVGDKGRRILTKNCFLA